VRETIANDYGLTAEEIVACPGFLIGSAAEIRERIEQLRNETGISYIMIWAETQDLVERFAEAVVDPLTGK
jgi:alkanesulfonate monooxygenase SsuD/methylene tetrahydromethanopterin reductase-like flavin-dependent oxidoreductase (luciferase family)